MDIRTTLKNKDTFLAILNNCFDDNEKVAMLLDNNGLVRAEGFIKNINVDSKKPFIEMEGGLKIVLATITAVNGIFLPSYSEC